MNESMLTPARRRGFEILDDPSIDAETRRRSLSDVARSNRLLGGLRAAMLELRPMLTATDAPAALLDVGTGLADIPSRACEIARAAGVRVSIIGVDAAISLLSAARDQVDHAVCADALSLPFRDASIDVVMCSQILHHFESADAERLVRELNRVARRAVIVADLRRSWIAAGGFWLVSFPLRFHPVTRHDGVVSVLRGFTRSELSDIVRNAVGVTPMIRRRLGFRLTASWQPSRAA